MEWFLHDEIRPGTEDKWLSSFQILHKLPLLNYKTS